MYSLTVRVGELLAKFKAWSNFRLMVLIGAAATIISIGAGAVYVQAAITSSDRNADLATSDAPASASSDRRQAPISSGESSQSKVSPERNLARANKPPPVADRGEDFSVTCSPGGVTTAGLIPPAASCKVDSYGGFNGRIELSCAQTPPNLTCEFAPPGVTPPANGSVGFQLLVVSDAVPPGSHVFEVVGRRGNKVNSFAYPFVKSAPAPLEALVPLPQQGTRPPLEIPVPPVPAVSPSPAEATFTIACTLAAGPQSAIDKLLWSFTQGSKGTIKCLVTPKNGFDEEVTLSLANSSDQIAHSFTPATIKPNSEGSSFVDLNFELLGLEKGKEYRFDVTGTSQSKTLIRRVELMVTE